MNIKKIKSLFEIKIGPFELDVDDQKEILSKFPPPKNLIERSFFQYRCQTAFVSSGKVFLKNFIAFLTTPLVLIISILNHYLFPKKANQIQAIFPYKKVFNAQIIPEAIVENYNIEVVDFYQKGRLKIEDLKFIVKVCLKKPFLFFFHLKIILKISFYRALIEKYNPELIVVANEYSFTSSILTHFCHVNNVKHFNVMHGEKLFFIRDSFFYFDKCFVWDSHYINLFEKLRAPTSQFEVTFPKYKLFESSGNKKDYFATYYLGSESKEELENIYENLILLKKKNISVRPHPRYSNLDLVKKIFTDIEIENINTVDIYSSLDRTERVISLYSSVLYEAYVNDKEIVIDDVSFESNKLSMFRKIELLVYAKPHSLLSNMINSNSLKHSK